MSERSTIFLFERGILESWKSIFGGWDNWPNQSVAWVHSKTSYRAQTLPYFITAGLSGITRKWRAKNFARMIQKYYGWRIVIVAHSEGTATAIEALRQLDWPFIDTLHLICGACDANFGRNGLCYALRMGRIRKVICYVAGQDQAMWAEDTLLGKLFFELPRRDRPLGLHGPIVPDFDVAHRVKTVQKSPWNGWGHSSCWNAHNFDTTMREVVFG